MSNVTAQEKCEMKNGDSIALNEDPIDLPAAKLLIAKYRQKCRMQAEQIMAWKKAFNLQRQQHLAICQTKSDQLSALTSQLYLLESRLRRKQRHIANILIESECTILRQQKIIEMAYGRTASSLATPFGDFSSSCGLDNLNDSDSAVVLEDVDSDSNMSTSIILRRRSAHASSGDVTIVRSISDAIDSTLSKYTGSVGSNSRRSNCYLRRPDILETVYSVEEDPEPDAAEKRDNFKKQAKIGLKSNEDSALECGDNDNGSDNGLVESSSQHSPSEKKNGTQVVNYNRVMSNHRSVTKPKDVKYKRINKAKSKSLEELRGCLKHWVERGNIELVDAQKTAHSYV